MNPIQRTCIAIDLKSFFASVEYVESIIEKRLDGRRCLIEIYNRIRRVFILCKFFYNGRFADMSCALYY